MSSKKEISRRKAMWTMIIFSILGNLVIAFAAFYTVQKDNEKTIAVHYSATAEMKKAVLEAAQTHEKILQQSSEAVKWRLR